jgi:predicted phosphodiesterase
VIVQIMSDLHLDAGSNTIPPLAEGAKLVVVAGDTCEGLVKAVELLRAAFPDAELAMVAGNHEFYGRVFKEELEAGRERASALGVHLLENGTATFGRLRVIGATFWTDYLLFGPHLRQAVMRAAYDQMRDHKRIRWNRKPWLRFRPQEALSLHVQSRNFFEAELARPFDGHTMLLAHHGMTWEALDPANERSLLAAAYVSEAPFVANADFVVTGHTHRPINFRRGRTRFLSNPQGYPDEGVRFDPGFVVEIPDAD